MLKKTLTLLTLITLGSSVSAEDTPADHAPAGDPSARAAELSKACAACHGADGNETIGGTFPRIAGQYQSYLEHALGEYRAGRRENAVMATQAANLSDADIAALSAHYAGLPGRIGTVRKH